MPSFFRLFKHHIMTDYKKMLCEDMKLFIFEWVILNPEEGNGIKYVRNLNKQELIKVCSYIDGKLSRDEMMEVIIAKQEHFRELARKRKDGCSSSDSSDSSSLSSESSKDSDSSSLSSECSECSKSSLSSECSECSKSSLCSESSESSECSESSLSSESSECSESSEDSEADE